MLSLRPNASRVSVRSARRSALKVSAQLTVDDRKMMAIVGGVLSFSMLLSPLQAGAVSGGKGISVPLDNQDFSGQDLRDRLYTKASLRNVDFSNTNLSGVSLFGALAPGAKFVGANLQGASLESADLEGADLTNADLTGAFLTNAQLKGVKIDGADFTDVVLRKDQQTLLCKLAKGTNPKTGVDTRESLYCS